MKDRYTEADFEQLSWHDCHIWRFELRSGEPEEGDWASDFALEIDFIAEWICGTEGGAQFRVIPATLVFQGVTDLKIHVDWSDTGFQCALHDVSIDRIERQHVADQKVCLDRPYYEWRIRLNWPEGGLITFGAAGFMQTLHGGGILTGKQKLSLNERRRLTGR
jgi:hypothetical protein